MTNTIPLTNPNDPKNPRYPKNPKKPSNPRKASNPMNPWNSSMPVLHLYPSPSPYYADLKEENDIDQSIDHIFYDPINFN